MYSMRTYFSDCYFCNKEFHVNTHCSFYKEINNIVKELNNIDNYYTFSGYNNYLQQTASCIIELFDETDNLFTFSEYVDNNAHAALNTNKNNFYTFYRENNFFMNNRIFLTERVRYNSFKDFYKFIFFNKKLKQANRRKLMTLYKDTPSNLNTRFFKTYIFKLSNFDKKKSQITQLFYPYNLYTKSAQHKLLRFKKISDFFFWDRYE